MITKLKKKGFQTVALSPFPTAVSDDPLENIAPATDQILDNIMEVENNFMDIMNVPDVPQDFEIDEETHHLHVQNLVNCNIWTFYEDESDWFKDKITWYNTKMEKLS